MRKGVVALVIAAALGAAAAPTASPAAEDIGEAAAVADGASATGQAGDRRLEVGSRLFVGDRVATDEAGVAQLVFGDAKGIAVAADSAMVIVAFPFSAVASSGRAAVHAQGGSYRYVGGLWDSTDSGIRIRAPQATVHVAGTAADVTVTPSGGTWLLSLRGPATLCSAAGECRTVEDSCSLLKTEDGKIVEEIPAGPARAQGILQQFPFVAAPERLLEPFRVAEANCATGGLAKFTLDQPGIRTPVALAAGAAAAAIAACLTTGCGSGGGGGGGPAIDTNNNTN